MQNNINSGVSCAVTECRFNQDGMHCELDRIHVGSACNGTACTCCDSFQKRR